MIAITTKIVINNQLVEGEVFVELTNTAPSIILRYSIEGRLFG